jgi:predicted choloylglycine hydrolase
VVLAAEPDHPRPGIPFHFLPRLVLETCATTRAAVELLTHIQHLHTFNYLIADSSGDLAVVEAHPERVRVIAPDGPFIATTNHYRHPDMLDFQRGRKLDHSRARLDFLYASPSHWSRLTDHSTNLCGHVGGHTTLWSLTANLTTHTVAYAFGPPCEAPYQPVLWPG